MERQTNSGGTAVLDEPQDQAEAPTASRLAAVERREAAPTAAAGHRRRRMERVLARLRRRQLELAIGGDVVASARQATRARRLRGWLAGGLATLAMVASVAWAPAAAAADQAPAHVVRAGEVRQEWVQQHQRVTGTLRAVSRARVAAQESAAVVRVLVREGDAVQPGQVIAEFDDRRLTAQWREAQAEAATAEAQVAERSAELVRVQRDADKLAELRSSRAATQREYDDALTAVRVAEAQLDLARRRVEQAQQRVALLAIRLQDTRVLAPFDGRVVQRHVEPGVWVNPGDPIVTVVSTGRIDAWLEVPERLIEALADGEAPLSVAVHSDGQARPAVATRIVPNVDPRVRTFALIAALDNSDGALSPGMSVSAWVPAGASAMRTTVPKDAVVRTAQGALVYRAIDDPAGGDRVAQPVPVKVLFETADRVVVESSQLSDSDVVVVEGNERLMPRTPLVLAQ